MNFLYFSTLCYDEADGAHNPTQIARALARRAHRGLFIEPQPSAKRDTEHLPLEIVALTELGLTSTQLRRAWYGLESKEPETVAQALAERTTEWKEHEPRAAIYSAPFDPFVRLVPVLRARNFTIVYYAMDNFAAAPALEHTQFAPAAQEYLAREADVLCAVTANAVQSPERSRVARVIPNGIDVQAFRGKTFSAPAQLERGELTLGFWGTLIDSMFDADLVAHAAAARPQWNIHLLGAPDPEPHRPSIVARLKPFKNIFFHGAVPHQELPRYAAAFDVCLAPFPDNAFTRGRDPIKIYEYLAAHVPVAASYAPQLASLPYVFVAQSPDDLLHAIEQAARARVDAPALDAFLARQSWDARASALLEALREAKPSARGDGTILPTFANPDARAVMRYAEILERELEQTQTWARELERIAQTRGGLKRFLPKRAQGN